MTQYEVEAVDRLPFSTPEKSERYRTESYRGAVGLNWYRTDPTLQLTMAYYLQPDELAVVEPHLSDIGELMGGPVARWAEQTDRNPAHLERYDRWGHDISQVVQPTSFIESKRAVLSAQKALKDDARQAGINRRCRCSRPTICSIRPTSAWGVPWERAAAWSSRSSPPTPRPTCANTCWPNSQRRMGGPHRLSSDRTRRRLRPRALETTATRQGDSTGASTASSGLRPTATARYSS